MLGQKYSTVRGGLLLRVAGTLKPSVADAYKAAFLGYSDRGRSNGSRSVGVLRIRADGGV